MALMHPVTKVTTTRPDNRIHRSICPIRRHPRIIPSLVPKSGPRILLNSPRRRKNAPAAPARVPSWATAHAFSSSDPSPRVPETRSGPLAARHVPSNVCAGLGGPRAATLIRRDQTSAAQALRGAAGVQRRWANHLNGKGCRRG